jgi:hypothetical protein
MVSVVGMLRALARSRNHQQPEQLANRFDCETRGPSPTRRPANSPVKRNPLFLHRQFKFQKRRELFIRAHNETLSVVVVRTLPSVGIPGHRTPSVGARRSDIIRAVLLW